jgi:hypothetical protein
MYPGAATHQTNKIKPVSAGIRLFEFGPFALYHTPHRDGGSWLALALRLNDSAARKRVYYFGWSPTLQRVSLTPDSARLVEENEPLMRQVLMRLKQWKPASASEGARPSRGAR